ncbi:MAG TPA: MmcQ/YjbR family DNA-binding protein, partial [Acidobacteriota bacterium]|nr:MmcQ/YjbR family DNA-binding protein [Acidobacteriota bacterium]
FRVGGKMFTVVNLDPPHHFSFKCTPEKFVELTQTEGIIPAPYMARHHWVQIRDHNALKFSEIQQLIGESYRLVFEKLPLGIRKELQSPPKKKGRPKGPPRKTSGT